MKKIFKILGQRSKYDRRFTFIFLVEFILSTFILNERNAYHIWTSFLIVMSTLFVFLFLKYKYLKDKGLL
jgi:Ca2+/Na+ antiporter